jgi:hypothetical protein
LRIAGADATSVGDHGTETRVHVLKYGAGSTARLPPFPQLEVEMFEVLCVRRGRADRAEWLARSDGVPALHGERR